MPAPPSTTDPARLPPGMARQGMAVSLVEGMVVAGMYIFLEQWLVALIQNRLGGTPQVIALALTTIPVLGSVIMGLGMHWFIHQAGGNRRAVLIAGWLQIAAMALLLPVIQHPEASWSLPAALAAGSAITLLNPFSQTGWSTWMGELVPESIQGRYLGRRYFAFHLARLIFFQSFGLIISCFPPVGPDDGHGTGLTLVLIAAIVSRLASVALLHHQPVPPSLDLDPRSAPSLATSLAGLKDFLGSASQTFFGRWTILWACMTFGIGITGPFIATYLTAPVNQGGMGLTDRPWLYAGIGQAGCLSRLVLMPLMGRLVDRHGAATVLRLSLVGVSVVTVGWALITDPRWLLANEVFATMCWSGAETAVLVLLLTCHGDPAQRPRLMGYYHLLGGIATVLSSLVGTWLVGVLPPFHGSVFRSLFLAGLCIRIPVAVAAWWILASSTASRQRLDS